MCGWDERGSLEDAEVRFALCVWRRQLTTFLSFDGSFKSGDPTVSCCWAPELSYPHWNLSLRLWTFPGAFLAGVPPVATPGKAEGLVWPGQRGCFAAGPRYPPAYLPPISPDLNWAWHAPVERDSPGIKALLLWFGLAADVKHDMILEDFLSLPWNKAATGIKRALCWGCNHITNWTLPHVRAGTSTLAYLTCICPKVQMLRSWHSIIWI